MHERRDVLTGERTLVIEKNETKTVEKARTIIAGLAKHFPVWKPVHEAIKDLDVPETGKKKKKGAAASSGKSK